MTIKPSILIVLLFTFSLSAQKKTADTSQPVWAFSFDVMYGQSMFIKDYYHQLNSVDRPNWRLPMRQVGIGYSNLERGFGAGNSYSIKSQASFSYFLKNTFSFGDSLKSDISGFSVGYCIGKVFFKKSKHFRFNTFLGVNAGRSVLTKQDNLNLKNPFIAPKLLLQPKVIIGRLCVSLFLDYCYDLSDKHWKMMRKAPSLYKLEPFDQSKLALMFSIGYCPF